MAHSEEVAAEGKKVNAAAVRMEKVMVEAVPSEGTAAVTRETSRPWRP